MLSIRIGGAGLSGLTAAINIAKAGFNVKVFEKNKNLFNGSEICCFRNYDLKIDAIEELRKCGIKIKPNGKVKRVVKFSPNEKAEEYSKKPIFYLVWRGDENNSLEKQLYKQALDLGVEFVFGKAVKENEVDIVATGPKRTDIFAYGYIYKGIDIDKLYVVYNNLYSPKGYTYIVGLENKCMVCAVSFDKKNFKYIPVNFDLFLRKNEFLRKLVGKKKPIKVIKGFGNYDWIKTAENNGRLYVGEAGFFQDPSKGFGMRYAIITGYLAAKSIITGERYDNLWKQKIQEELKRDLKRRIEIDKLTNKDYDNLLKNIKKINIDEYVKVTRKERKHLDLFLPLYIWYWKLRR